MRFESLALVAIAISTVTATPNQVAAAKRMNQLRKREFINDANGNLKLTFSDEKITIGTTSIDDIIGKLYEACSTQGQCDTSPIDIKDQLIPAGRSSVTDQTLQINPSGSYPTWIHNGLLDALSAAAKAVAECTEVTHVPTCGFSPYYCPSDPFKANQCKIPQYWGINYQAPDATNAAPPFIGADMNVTPDDGGFCSTLLDSMAAVAGAVHGVGGGIFSLFSLACQD